jgi:hypothetical protein
MLLLGWLVGIANLSAAEFARVERLQGEAWVERDGQRQKLLLAATVVRDDLLQTGPQSRLQLVLAKGGNLTLGENASLRVTQSLEASAKTINRLDVKGAFRMVSAAAQMPHKQEWVLHTPVATIGVRGTDFWGGPIDGALDVMVLSGAVEVINDAGRVLLQPNQGTVVRDLATSPSAPVIWGAAKVQRALSMVAFPDH